VATELWGVVIAALDPEAQARWWADALGWSWTLDDDDTGDTIVASADPTVPRLLFERVADAKTAVKNRVHLDLASESADAQSATVARLLAAGAASADVGQGTTPWVVLADPEGNELCVLEPRDRYAGAPGLAAIVLDANDPDRLAEFWSAATGWAVGNRGEYGVSLHRPGDRPPDLDLVRVPEPKTVKGRVHLDVHPAADGDRDVEVARLRALGATPADVGQGPDVSWTVLADPEGNELCVLRPQ
jgi:predicted enzyme related to lactoylglutathione lyase